MAQKPPTPLRSSSCVCCAVVMPDGRELRCPPCAAAHKRIPVAYSIHRSMWDGFWYPMRFGAYRINVQGTRLACATLEEAVAYCCAEQRDYARRYPSLSDLNSHNDPPTGGAA